MPTVRRLANDLISLKSFCVATFTSSCAVPLLIFLHIIQILDGEWMDEVILIEGTIDIGMNVSWIGGDVIGANSSTHKLNSMKK